MQQHGLVVSKTISAQLAEIYLDPPAGGVVYMQEDARGVCREHLCMCLCFSWLLLSDG